MIADLFEYVLALALYSISQHFDVQHAYTTHTHIFTFSPTAATAANITHR